MLKASLGIDDDIDFWAPAIYEPKQCPQCGCYIVEGAEAYWVVENPSDGFYTPYCNEFHYQAYHKTGLWKEEKVDPPALTLE